MSFISKHNDAHATVISWILNQEKEILNDSDKQLLFNEFTTQVTDTNKQSIKNFTNQLCSLVKNGSLSLKKAVVVSSQVNHCFREVYAKDSAKTAQLPKPSLSKRDRNESDEKEVNTQKSHKIRKIENKTPTSAYTRTYPPISAFDTIIIRDGKVASVHGTGLCFQDKEIVAVSGRSLPATSKPIPLPFPVQSIYAQPITGNKSSQKEHPIARTSDKKAILQQQATRGCTAACVEMLKADHNKSIDWNYMSSTNLGNTDSMKRALEKSGFKVSVNERVPFNELNDHLCKNGSAIISVDAGCGGHVIVLDKMDYIKKTADVREPYHGWAITITFDALQKAMGGSTTVIQVK